MPGELDKSSNSSSLTLKETVNGPSSAATQNIFPATEKHRSCPHLISSVTAGNARHISRKLSISISLRLLLSLNPWESCGVVHKRHRKHKSNYVFFVLLCGSNYPRLSSSARRACGWC